MKRYIYAMAIPKKEARAKLESYADIVQRHVIECVVYSSWQGTRYHWITELAAWMSKAARIKCKSVLTEKDYRETILGVFGDEINDAMFDLEEYRDSAVRQARYPDFDITEELASELLETYKRFIGVSLRNLLKGDVTLAEDWAIILDGEVFQ